MFAIREKTDIIVPSKIYSMAVGERLYVLSPLSEGFTAWGVLTHCFIVNRYIAAWTHAGGIIIFLFLLGWITFIAVFGRSSRGVQTWDPVRFSPVQ